MPLRRHAHLRGRTDVVFRSRVVTFACLLSWAAIPAGTLVGGALIEWTQDVALIYGWIGGLMVVITGAFFFTPLGRVRQDGTMQQ